MTKLIGTNEPSHPTRKFAFLDHLNNGRAAWDMVTSNIKAKARNCSLD
ncbi:LLM class flavin-dependent oxidoreductase [Peribacillus asahii]|uniref:LLM class flavin-dependent oxidoreductase n=1 Tax=Peribacillus asahii TaxID=228899 RepID=A0A398B0V2_9BACI|nr:LLM class flavin-dependent oxidoreductase [Peribacillus asahii]